MNKEKKNSNKNTNETKKNQFVVVVIQGIDEMTHTKWYFSWIK